MSRLTIQEHTKEVEKPQGGGGHGQQALYAAEILLDGQPALTLQTHHFAKPGQFADFLAILNERRRSGAGTDPLPLKMNRMECINALRAARAAQVATEAAAAAARPAAAGRQKGDLSKGQRPPVWPVDAIIDYIEACGFPEK